VEHITCAEQLTLPQLACEQNVNINRNKADETEVWSDSYSVNGCFEQQQKPTHSTLKETMPLS